MCWSTGPLRLKPGATSYPTSGHSPWVKPLWYAAHSSARSSARLGKLDPQNKQIVAMPGGAPKNQHPHTQLQAAQGSQAMCSSLGGERSFLFGCCPGQILSWCLCCKVPSDLQQINKTRHKNKRIE